MQVTEITEAVKTALENMLSTTSFMDQATKDYAIDKVSDVNVVSGVHTLRSALSFSVLLLIVIIIISIRIIIMSTSRNSSSSSNNIEGSNIIFVIIIATVINVILLSGCRSSRIIIITIIISISVALHRLRLVFRRVLILLFVVKYAGYFK